MKKAILLIFVFLPVTYGFSQGGSENNRLMNEFNRLLNKPFAALELEDEKGNLFNTASLKGKTLYVDFWFTQCPPCLAQIPHAKALKTFFSSDTNIVFLNICIDYKKKKDAWKQLIQDKEIGGIHLFYARNQPQRINLLREYKVEQFPTYMLVNNEFNIIGYNAPAPSDKGLVHWSISQAAKNIKLSDSFKSYLARTKEVKEYLNEIQTKANVVTKAK